MIPTVSYVPQGAKPYTPLVGGAYPFFAFWEDWNHRPGSEEFLEKKPTVPFSDYRDVPFAFDAFYAFFPEFEGAEAYPQAFIAAAAKQARMFVRLSWCRELDGPDREYALALTVAHMAVVIKQRQASLLGSATPGQGAFSGMDGGPGVVTSASVGGVSVSKGMMVQPKNNWEEFFYQTPYGRTLMAFLGQCAPAGLFYEGGDNIASYLRP